MPQQKGTRGPISQHRTSEALPTGRKSGAGLLEESAWSDHPDSFFTEGMVKSLAGNSNVLVVCPNMSPDADDKNIGLLTYWLAEALGAYAVANCGCYRRPVEGDPAPGELQRSSSLKSSKEDKKILQLRQRLWGETGGIPVDLDEFWFAKKAAYDFVEPIWSAAQAIGQHAIPLVFFMEGIDDERANEHEVDIAVAVAVGNPIRDDNIDEIRRNNIDSAPPAFIRELIDRLSLFKDGIRSVKEPQGIIFFGGIVFGG